MIRFSIFEANSGYIMKNRKLRWEMEAAIEIRNSDQELQGPQARNVNGLDMTLVRTVNRGQAVRDWKEVKTNAQFMALTTWRRLFSFLRIKSAEDLSLADSLGQ